MESNPEDLKILLSKKEIRKGVEEIANQINDDYKNKHPLLIGILKGEP